VYQGRVVHVASYATKFLFTSEQLNQPVERLSGGERARVLIAKLMLEPADLLLLDEPTNDLDIATLEILEDSLLEYTGALVLVTHDRYMLDRVSTVVLGLDGRGAAEMFADYSQWEQWQRVKVEEAGYLNSPGATGKAVASVSGGGGGGAVAKGAGDGGGSCGVGGCGAVDCSARGDGGGAGGGGWAVCAMGGVDREGRVGSTVVLDAVRA
jgi:ATP-binding cassette subfamily F protein uup